MTHPSTHSRRATVLVVTALVAFAGMLVGGCCAMRAVWTPGTLEVRVVEDDVPVAGAMVTVHGTLPLVGETYPVAPAAGDGRTGADGVALFESVDPAAHEVSVGHDDFVFHQDEDVRVDGGERMVHVVMLRRGARIEGRVLDPAGRPMDGVEVQVLAQRRAANGDVRFEDLHVRATTDAAGAFLTRAVEPGASLMLRVHEFRDGRAIVAQSLVASPKIGRNDAGDLRVLDTLTVLRLEGEPVRRDLRAHGSVAGTAPDGTPWSYEFGNRSFADDATAPVIGLPDGVLRWRLVESRLGPEPNQIVVGEGTADVAGPRREVVMRRTSSDR